MLIIRHIKLQYTNQTMKRALLIGINYKGQEGELGGCINDIQNINSVLVNNCGYDPKNIRILTEESNIQPTRSNIEANINWLITGVMPEDTLVFYYSGHGAFIPDRSGDESDGRDEVIVPLDYQTRGIITDDWLFTNMVGRVPAGASLWAFTDCCHSGTMIDLKYNYKSQCKFRNGTANRNTVYRTNEWTNNFTMNIEKSRDIPGNVILFSGSLDEQTAADAQFNGRSNGAFTRCLLDYINANLVTMPDRTQRLSSGKTKLIELLKEINCRLEIRGFGGQDSQLSCAKAADYERTFSL